jgi:hypothetical protein
MEKNILHAQGRLPDLPIFSRKPPDLAIRLEQVGSGDLAGAGWIRRSGWSRLDPAIRLEQVGSGDPAGAG